MGKKIITVIASVLKPVDDTRMYEKLALSLQQTNRYEVNIIGFASKKPPVQQKISFFPAFRFRSASPKRIFASLVFIKLLISIKPALLIIGTYELLPVAVLYKLCRRECKLVYDVRENYALNLRTNRGKGFLVNLIAKIIRLTERISQHFIELNILAEEKYAKEMPHLKHNVVLLNKYRSVTKKEYLPQRVEFKQRSHSTTKILYCGTISEVYGICQSLDLIRSLKRKIPGLEARIIGHVTNDNLLNKLVTKYPEDYIYWDVALFPVPHQDILDAIKLADFGLVAHQPVESIRNCFPTRIYEFMALGLPFILQDHPLWTGYASPWDCCIITDFNNFDTDDIVYQMKTRRFYSKGIPEDVYWNKEGSLLIVSIDKLFNYK
jgi:hypothetical protein